jgi:hypothetical protein
MVTEVTEDMESLLLSLYPGFGHASSRCILLQDHGVPVSVALSRRMHEAFSDEAIVRRRGKTNAEEGGT